MWISWYQNSLYLMCYPLHGLYSSFAWHISHYSFQVVVATLNPSSSRPVCFQPNIMLCTIKNQDEGAGTVASQVKPLCLYSLTECLGLSPASASIPASFECAGEAAGNGSCVWFPASGTPDIWFQPGPTSTIVAILRVNQQMEDVCLLHSPFLPLCHLRK